MGEKLTVCLFFDILKRVIEVTDTSVIISFLNANNCAKTRSIKNINPSANPNKIVTWAKAMIGITNNTYVSTAIIHKVKLD